MIKLKAFSLLILTAYAVVSPALSFAQSANNQSIDISQVGFETKIAEYVRSAYIAKDSDPINEYPTVPFITGLKHKGPIPNEYITKKLLIEFPLINSADTAVSVYFFPGFYFAQVQLYKISAGQLSSIPNVLPKLKDSIGYRLITLQPHDSATFLAELRFVKTYNNVARPRLIKANYLHAFMSELRGMHTKNDLITYVFCGLMLMMIFFSMASFLQGANREFLYYSGYAFFLGLMLFMQATFSYRSNRISFFIEGYLDFIMQGIGIVFYMIFMQKFLNTRQVHPFLYKLYKYGILSLIAALLIYTGLHYFSDNFNLVNIVENITKISLLLMIVVFLVYSYRKWDDVLLRYLFWGNLCLFIFAVISQLAVLWNPLFKKMPGALSSSVIYYEVGLLLELVFFLAGLNHKNRRQLISQTKEREMLKALNLMKEYEKEIAVYKAQQEERQRISADMHDELGSGMTAIRLMSEIARKKMKDQTPVEIEKISHSANDVLNKMNAIIWSMNSGNDTLDNLISYIREYALEYFEGTPISCEVLTPEQIPLVELTGDKRRNIFLSIKETLNNALKHSEATRINILVKTDSDLCIEIRDNGKGIDFEKLRPFGNGLQNIARRMESIGGTYTIKNMEGTVIELRLPLA